MEKVQRLAELLGVKEFPPASEPQQYMETVRKFLQGQDFMRLGHCIQGRQWHLVMNNSAKLQNHCKELGITCFDRYIKYIREAARRQDQGEAFQIMSRITAKRVQVRNYLAEEGDTCDM